MHQPNAVLTAIHERRSIRRYTSAPVSREDVLAILDTGRWAPSGLNNQAWRFLVIHKGDERQEMLTNYTKYERIVRDAGVLVCVFLHRASMYNPMKDYQGAGACIQNMLLAVHSLGLGAVWLGEIVNHAEQVIPALKLDPEQVELMAVLAIGHPDQRGSAERKPLADLLLEPY